jgi:hypothetical protein
MRSKFLLALLLVATFAFWRADPTYGLMGRIDPCSTAFAKANDCHNFHGPIHTAEGWTSIPGDRRKLGTYSLLTYSREGLLIGREDWENGALTFRNRYEKRDGGLTIVYDSEWTKDGKPHHQEEIVSLNQQGEAVSSKTNLDGGPFTVGDYRREFDAAGHEVLFQQCSMDGKNCSSNRTESEYDGQGRLTLRRQIELPSGRVALHMEYEYPGENRKRTLDFGGCRDSDTPASVPTYVIETSYDSAGRVIEETTSAPGKNKMIWCEDTPEPGRVLRQYDGQGHLMELTREIEEPIGTRQQSWSYSYDKFGNEISEHLVEPNLAGPDTRFDHQFDYKYDRHGNVTSKTSYVLDSAGNRRQIGPIENWKFTYYRR